MKILTDREEYQRIVETSETGSYIAQGFLFRNYTKEQPVTELGVAQETLTALAKRLGWDTRLAKVSGSMTSMEAPGGPDPGGGLTTVTGQNFQRTGGWWVNVPIDYLNHFDADLDDEKEMIFEVKDRKRAVGMWAFEAWTRLQNPGMALGDFGYTVESCISGETLYQYHDHPDAEAMVNKILG